MPSTKIDEAWILAHLSKLIDAERAMAATERSRADSPPEPSMVSAYQEASRDDERHAGVLETIAVRYGHTPSRASGGGVGETITRLKDQVSHLTAKSWDVVEADLAAKSAVIGRETVWAGVFEAIGDTESAAELREILDQDRAHADALTDGLTRIAVMTASPDAIPS